MAVTSKQKIILAVVASLALILSVAAVVNYGRTANNTKSLATIAQEEVDPVTYQDWVVYNNDTLKFSIEIPKEWTVDEERDSENQPTGNVTFKPSSNASSSATTEIRVSFRKGKEAMTNLEEFTTYKNADFSGLVNNYQKITRVSIKNGEAILFKNTTSNERLELLSWIYKNQDSVFVETVNDGSNQEDAVKFHRYLLSTVSF
ncbi:MAG: hypothetical protein QG639_70 [Patescibacteria group bacterium]|nr:hypothetical protein [Patescibacteria group bacterium]